MSYNQIKKLFICLLVGFFIFSLNGNVFAGGSISIKWGKGSGSDQPKSVKLPSSLRVGLGDSVSIELDTDEPYNHHKEHVKKYPPKKSNYNKKKKS